jgi:hypothetical protein
MSVLELEYGPSVWNNGRDITRLVHEVGGEGSGDSEEEATGKRQQAGTSDITKGWAAVDHLHLRAQSPCCLPRSSCASAVAYTRTQVETP